MTLPTAASRVTGVVTLLVAHNLGRAHCGRRSGRLGGRCAARGWYGDAPGGSRTVCGGPSSVSGFRSVWPVALHTNDATRQALTARAMLVLTARASGSVATGPLLARIGTGRPAPDEPTAIAFFFLVAMATKNR